MMELRSKINFGEDASPTFTINGQAPNESLVLEAVRLIPYTDLLNILEEYTITYGQNEKDAIKKTTNTFTLNLSY